VTTAQTTSKSAAAIDKARAEGRAALIGYLPAGYPSVEQTIAAGIALAENGADLIEIGIPYSDPVMDGQVIQAATTEALAKGFSVSQVFDVVHGITSKTDAAVLVMTYWNPVVRMGVDEFSRRLAEAGGAGLITPDLIPDEAAEWIAASDAADLDRVFLVAPSSTDARLASTTAACRGFVYAASTMGVTGTRATVGNAAATLVARTRAVAPDLAVCVGLGVSDGRQAAEVATFADGVIVGSAYVREMLEGRGAKGVRALSEDLARGVRA
jgi:tryptophan synthase alpha chain